jgi:hypothetical protein
MRSDLNSEKKWEQMVIWHFGSYDELKQLLSSEEN